MHGDIIVQRAVGKTLQMKQKHHRHTLTFVYCNICSASLDTHSEGTEGWLDQGSDTVLTTFLKKHIVVPRKLGEEKFVVLQITWIPELTLL